MSETQPTVEERVAELEKWRADMEAAIAQLFGGEDVNVDPVEAAFLRNRERANKA